MVLAPLAAERQSRYADADGPNFCRWQATVSKGASRCTREESNITVAGQNPRWCHVTEGTAAQDKAHFMDCSHGIGSRHEKLFESGDGHYTNGVSFVSLARNTDRNTQHGRGKASGATIRAKFQTPHPTATTRRERWDTVSECVRGEASASETWFQHDGLPIKPPNKPLQTDERRVLVWANLRVDSRAARG